LYLSCNKICNPKKKLFNLIIIKKITEYIFGKYKICNRYETGSKSSPKTLFSTCF
jgi:hypothetical protein